MGKKIKEYENIKLSKKTVDKLRKHKKQTGIAISIFVEKLIANALSTNTDAK